MLVNGDTLTDVDLPAMIRRHRESGAMVTMALIPNRVPRNAERAARRQWCDRFIGIGVGIVTCPEEHQRVEGFHFIGPQVVNARVFADLEDGVPAESVLEVYPRLMRDRPGSVMGFAGDWSFRDIGTPADLLQTSLALAAEDGRAGCPHWGRRTRVDPSSRVTRSVLWDDVTIGPGAELTECVVADGVTIPAGARYHRQAIVQGPDGPLVAALLNPRAHEPAER